MSQEALGAHVGLSQGRISEIELGKSKGLDIFLLNSIAEALGVSPAYLLGLTDDPLKGVDDDEDEPLNLRESSPPYITDPTTKELLDLLHELDPEQRRRFIDGAKLLLGVPRIIE